MVDILMATYNGELYIKDQIESILKQTYKEWKLYIRDDGSYDNTINIINKYIEEYPDKIVLIKDNYKNLGCKNNFIELLNYSKNNYSMFCDQDDVWLEDKIERTIKLMKKLESDYGAGEPILVHTDLKVVDSSLNIVSSSFWKCININPHNNNLNRLFIENTVTGCTMMINKNLANLCNSIPKECLMHDWWLAIMASCFGKIGILEEQTILYRQHSNNQVGVRKKSIISRLKEKIHNPKSLLSKLNLEIEQVKAFYNIYNIYMSNDVKLKFENFISLKQNGYLKRKKIMIKEKFYRNSFIKTIQLILFV